MREWILEKGFAGAEELDTLEEMEGQNVQAARDTAWLEFRAPIDKEKHAVLSMTKALEKESDKPENIAGLRQSLERKSGRYG